MQTAVVHIMASAAVEVMTRMDDDDYDDDDYDGDDDGDDAAGVCVRACGWWVGFFCLPPFRLTANLGCFYRAIS